VGLNPDENAWDGAQVMGPEAHFDGQTWRLWYTGTARQRHSSGIAYYRIGLATSNDGITFRRANAGDPVLGTGPKGAPDEVQAATPSIVREDDRWRMWYAAWSPGHSHSICEATSTDGIAWNRSNSARTISGLDPPEAYGHAVCRTADGYLLLYMGLRAKAGLYAAFSADGTNWTMHSGHEPRLKPGPADAFDSRLVGHPFLFPTADHRLLLWYTGYANSPGGPHGWRLRIGLAEGLLRSQ
jgi:hypothetical protein